MDTLFEDVDKIKSFAKIQRDLLDLKPNSSDKEIQDFINGIPQHLLTHKDDLMMICQLFSHYAKFISPLIRGNAIKLFDKIKEQIKTYLPDESFFFCKIFGGLFYFKLLMYEEGIITIDHIIMSILRFRSSEVAEYFLPEIIKDRPEIFDKEIKFIIKCPYSEDYIQQFKETRKKHIQWIRTSCDFHDPLYKEIETNKLRLSIKTDDFDTFQKILSNSNFSIDSKINESVFDNYHEDPHEVPLIELVINYDAIQIFKFMILNNVNISEGVNFTAVSLHDNEIIHALESSMNEQFIKGSLFNAIGCWNLDFHEYLINNFDFNFIEQSDISSNYDTVGLVTLYTAVFSSNFIFFESFLLTFLQNNPRFVNDQFNEIVFNTLSDSSCFFFGKLVNDPRCNVNYHSKDNNRSILSYAIFESNTKAIEILFKNFPNLDVTSIANNEPVLTPFQCASKFFSEMKVLDLFLNHPKFDVEFRNFILPLNAFEYSVLFGNFYFGQKIDVKDLLGQNHIALVISSNLKNHYLMSLKLLLRKFINLNPTVNIDDFIQACIRKMTGLNQYKEEYGEILNKIHHELMNELNNK